MESSNRTTRYQLLAEQIKEQIKHHVWRAGDKVPSIRETSRTYSVSSSTTLQAYQLLESEGWLTAKPQSGYYVTALKERQEQVEHQSIQASSFDDELYQFLSFNREATVSFGSALPEPDLFPLQLLNRHLASSGRQSQPSDIVSDMPPGNSDLRRLIAQRYLAKGVNVSPEDIVITSGAMDALNLSLQVVTKPKDKVMVESPAFYGAIQATAQNGLNAIEITVDPEKGIDIAELEEIVKENRPRAMWLMPHFQNPTGNCLSDEVKQTIVQLANKYDFYLIEDDVYSELGFSGEILKPMKFWDREERVLLCGSFSKSLAPGYRVGWVINKLFSQPIQKQQLLSTLSCSSPIQQGIAHYLKYEGVDNHLRKLRKHLRTRLQQYSLYINQKLPVGCELFEPDGGYFLWLRLPEHVSSYIIYNSMKSKGVSIAFGGLFSADGRHHNYLRINASLTWCAEVESALNHLISELQANC